MKCLHSKTRNNPAPGSSSDYLLRAALGAFSESSWRKEHRSDHGMQVWRQLWFAEARKRQVEAP